MVSSCCYGFDKTAVLYAILLMSAIFPSPCAEAIPVNNQNDRKTTFNSTIFVSYKAEDTSKYSFLDTENNAFSIAAIMNMRSVCENGFGFGIELAGWTDMGLHLADAPRVSQAITPNLSGRWREMSDFEISQSYFLYRSGEYTIKIGRQAILQKISPWIFTGRSAGVTDIVYDAILLSIDTGDNSSLNGALFLNAVNIDKHIDFGDSTDGVFMLSAVNQPFFGVNYSVYCYYYPDAGNGPAFLAGRLPRGDTWSAWLEAYSDIGGVSTGYQLIYNDGTDSSKEETLAFSAMAKVSVGNIDLKLTGSYVNDGDYSVKTVGMRVGYSAFWGKSLNGEFGGDTVGSDQSILKLDYGFSTEYGKFYGGIAGVDYHNGTALKKAHAIQFGFSRDLDKVFIRAEYRHRTLFVRQNKANRRQRIRLDLVYRF